MTIDPGPWRGDSVDGHPAYNRQTGRWSEPVEYKFDIEVDGGSRWSSLPGEDESRTRSDWYEWGTSVNEAWHKIRDSIKSLRPVLHYGAPVIRVT